MKMDRMKLGKGLAKLGMRMAMQEPTQKFPFDKAERGMPKMKGMGMLAPGGGRGMPGMKGSIGMGALKGLKGLMSIKPSKGLGAQKTLKQLGALRVRRRGM